MMEIKNGSCLYRVGNRVAETGHYRLYLCIQEGTGRQCLLQVATSAEHNGGLQRAAHILKELQRRAGELEAEYARVKTDPKVLLNYQLGIPELVNSFICKEQGGRQINVFAFRNVENVSDMVPLSNITAKDHLRVDLRTSAWIMGKLLKLLVFAHHEGISVGVLDGNNIVIEPEQHYVVIFEWSAARMYPETVPAETRSREIAHAAQAVVIVLGGDLATGTFPDDGHKTYTDYLLRLARGRISDARKAYEHFYSLIDGIWEREYYPFTTKPLSAG